jgi:Tfp pilus assembly protein PilV
MRRWRSATGTSLIETAIALGVLSVGALGTAAIFTQGMERTKSSPGDLMATQKAQEAIESVFAARDSRTVTWAQLRNIAGAGGDGGIFLDGPQGIKDSGVDGIVNTAVTDAVYPTDVPSLPTTIGGKLFGASQIRKANLHVAVRSATKSTVQNDYLRTTTNTVVSMRNLAYFDRYSSGK